MSDDLRGLAAREQQAPKQTGSQSVWEMVIDEAPHGMGTGMESDALDIIAAIACRIYESATPSIVTARILDDMRAREAAGIARYGVPLTADNGRDHLLDAYQEALDLLVYLRAHREATR